VRGCTLIASNHPPEAPGPRPPSLHLGYIDGILPDGAILKLCRLHHYTRSVRNWPFGEAIEAL
jgi:hypothetical protein